MIRPKKLIFIPLVLFTFSLFILLYNYWETGDFISKDIDLKGGTLVTVESGQPLNVKLLEETFAKKYGSALVSGLKTMGGYGVSIEVPIESNTTEILNYIENSGLTINSYSIETIGPTLGSLFFQQIVYVLIIAFVLMTIVIFILYRNPVSSFGIVFAALANILTTLALASLVGIKISFAGIAALLMLIAYTVDTNIVLTNKVLKTEVENFEKQYKKALITGVTLIATISITMAVILFVSSSKLLVNIAEVLVIGFLADLPYTWIFNSTVLEWWVWRRAR